ncbi:hypothetical protein [Pararhodobacter sp. CCB-MM2]|uniref:hypothetical protein n=1 Tax=Pararhodobacter sp. CCB-MM2 TaxID=1786003 RepID=UPI00082B254F|nr:hypothetical protein [Pararhodobacter sp. CCB-MM2]
MFRRQFLLSAPALMLLPALPALAQSGPSLSASADNGNSGTIRPHRDGFLLEVSGLRFNIGMPPTNRLGNFEIQDLMAREITYRVGNAAVTTTLRANGTGQYTLPNGRSGSLNYRSQGGGTALGYLTITMTNTVVLGSSLGRGGAGQISIGGRSINFMLQPQS